MFHCIMDALWDGSIEVGVVQIDVWEDRAEESFGPLKTFLQALDILRGRIAFSVRRLIVGAICIRESTIGQDLTRNSSTILLTVAVDRAVSAWLLRVAFDFLSSTFVAGSRHSSTLLHSRLSAGLIVRGHAAVMRCRGHYRCLLLSLPMPFWHGRLIFILTF